VLEHAARDDSALHHLVRIRDLEPQRLGGAAARRGGQQTQLRVLVGQHQHAVAERDLGVADPAVRHHERLAAPCRAERGDVELHGGARVGRRQVRRDGVQRQFRRGSGGGRGLGDGGVLRRAEQCALEARPQVTGELRVGDGGSVRSVEGVEGVRHRGPPSPSAV